MIQLLSLITNKMSRRNSGCIYWNLENQIYNIFVFVLLDYLIYSYIFFIFSLSLQNTPSPKTRKRKQKPKKI